MVQFDCQKNKKVMVQALIINTATRRVFNFSWTFSRSNKVFKGYMNESDDCILKADQSCKQEWEEFEISIGLKINSAFD